MRPETFSVSDSERGFGAEESIKGNIRKKAASQPGRSLGGGLFLRLDGGAGDGVKRAYRTLGETLAFW